LKTWLVTGSTGFVGQALRRRLDALGATEFVETADHKLANPQPVPKANRSLTLQHNSQHGAELNSADTIQRRTEPRENPSAKAPVINEEINVLYAKRGQAATHLSEASLEAETNKAEANEAESYKAEPNKTDAKKAQPIDTVIHLAGVAHVGQAQAQQARAVNLDATLELLNAAISAGVRRFVYLSSTLAAAAEQGSGDITHYGRDKLAVEQALLTAAAEGKIEVVILRSVNIYGAGMRGNIAAMIRLMRAGRLPRLPLLNNKISLVSVTDVATALVTAASADLDCDPNPESSGSATSNTAANTKPKQQGKPAVRVTLTDGVDYSLNAIQDAIYATIERHPSRLRLPGVLLFAAASAAELLSYLGLSRSGISRRTYRQLTRDNLFDNTEARRALGFVPTTTFFETLPSIAAASREK
jgi:nucleoside-diphosphate-sugar epimerase